MRIAMIGSRGIGSNYGGIERVLDELCPRLAALGHSIDVFGRDEPGVRGAPAATANDGGGAVRAVATPGLKGKHFENLSRSAVAVSRSMGRYDLLHFHALGPGVFSSLTAMAKQPSVVTVHALDGKRDKWGVVARTCLGLAERAVVGSSDRVTVVSEPLRRYFVERYDMDAEFIPNGMTGKKRVAPGAGLASHGLEPRRYILFASRLAPEKGCHDLVAAFNALPTDMTLVVAGTSPAQDYIAALHAEADPSKVRFVGHQSQEGLAELFSNAYAFVLPSYIEGMSMALLEAMAFGVPIVVSDIPENRAVAGEYGLYFQPRDVAGLGQALGSLLGTPALADAMARRLQKLELPSWDYVAHRYDAIYREAAQPRRAAFSAGIRSLDLVTPRPALTNDPIDRGSASLRR